MRLEPIMRFALLLIALVRVAAADAVRDQAWQQDLDTLAIQLPSLHPNLFFHVSRSEWDASVAAVREAIPQLSDTEVMAAMAWLTALVRDGHTNLWLTQRNASFRLLPLSMRWFDDGLFITGAAQAYGRAAGARVIQIGDSPLADTYDAMTALISHENDSWVRDQSPKYLVNADLLQALKISSSNQSVRFVLEDAAGRFTMDIASLEPGVNTVKGTLAPDPNSGFIPYWRQNTAQNYWFTYVAGSKMLYFAYNVCADQAGRPFAQFNDDLWAAFDANPVERLVIDLRNNAGGNSEIINPFLASKTVRAGRMAKVQVVAIIGRTTFSSGVLGAIKLKNDPVMWVGEPSGGNPSSYGDVKTLVLPNSKLNVSYSTRLFTIPGYLYGPLIPDVAVASYLADYFARHDPFLAAVLAATQPGTGMSGAAVFNAAAGRSGGAGIPGDDLSGSWWGRGGGCGIASAAAAVERGGGAGERPRGAAARGASGADQLPGSGGNRIWPGHGERSARWPRGCGAERVGRRRRAGVVRGSRIGRSVDALWERAGRDGSRGRRWRRAGRGGGVAIDAARLYRWRAGGGAVQRTQSGVSRIVADQCARTGRHRGRDAGVHGARREREQWCGGEILGADDEDGTSHDDRGRNSLRAE